MNSYHVTCRELEIQRQSRRRISSLKHVVFCFKDLRASLCGLVDADRSPEFAETKANDSSITRHQRSLLTSLRGRKATLKTDSAKAIGPHQRSATPPWPSMRCWHAWQNWEAPASVFGSGTLGSVKRGARPARSAWHSVRSRPAIPTCPSTLTSRQRHSIRLRPAWAS